MAQAASFRVLNSACLRISISIGNTLPSIAAWICCRFPAVIFEIVQQASFRILSFVALNSCSKHGNTEQLSMTWVWKRAFLERNDLTVKIIKKILLEHRPRWQCCPQLWVRQIPHFVAGAWEAPLVWNKVTCFNTKAKYVNKDHTEFGTYLRLTPESITAWIFSLGPSDK